MKIENCASLLLEAGRCLELLKGTSLQVKEGRLDIKEIDGRLYLDLKDIHNQITKLQITISGEGKTRVVPQGGGKLMIQGILDQTLAKDERFNPQIKMEGQASEMKFDAEAKLKRPEFSVPQPPPEWPKGLYLVTDASCPGQQNVITGPLPYAYRGCVVEGGRIQRLNGSDWVLTSPDGVKGNNNLGEFLGLIAGLKWILNHPGHKIQLLYTDSQTAFSWFNNRKINPLKKYHDPNTPRYEVSSKYPLKANACAATQKAVLESLEWLKTHDADLAMANIEVHHWHTKAWGEIPADYGRK